MRRSTVLFLLTVATVLPCGALAAPPTVDRIVRFHEGVTPAERDAWLRDVQGEVLHAFSNGQAVAVRLPAAAAPDLATMGKDRRLAYVEGDAVGIPDVVPNDPLYTSQSHFRDMQYQDLDIQAEQAWELQNDASSVTAAIIDDGFLLTHPDLAGRFVPGYDCGNNDTNPSPDPDGTWYAHGTGVAGLLAAAGNNGIGVTGVCWNVRIMPLKHHNDFSNDYCSLSATLAAVDRAVAAHVDMIVCSFHYLGYEVDVSPGSQFYRSFKAASDAGIIVVAAAGNDGLDIDDPANARYPACFDFANVVTVAMTDNSALVAQASAHGSETVDISAPGIALMSTWVNPDRQATYLTIGGTSASTPLVAGVIALIKAAHPELTYPAGVLARMYERAETPPGNEAFVIGGRRVNLYRALAELDTIAPAAPTNLTLVAATDSSVTVSWNETGDDGMSGQLDHFLVRCRDINGWEATVPPPPAVTGLGTSHSITVSGLPYQAWVNTSITAVDDYRNRTTATLFCELPHAVLTAVPGTFFFLARTGADRDSTVVIRNSGNSGIVVTPKRAAGGDWLSFPTEPVFVAAGDSVFYDFHCSAAGLCSGFYTGQILFDCKKPVLLTVSMGVLDAPEAAVTPAALDLGNLAADAVVERQLAIVNTGCSPLHWSASLVPAGTNTVNPASGTIAPGASTNVTLGIAAGGSRPLTALITTDDPFDGTISVPVTWQPGSLAATPGNLDAPTWSAQPNPFNPRTTISYTLPRNGDAGLLIFDVRGALVRALPLGVSGPGDGTVTWDGCSDGGRAVPSGAYFCRLVQDGADVVPALRLQVVR
jgi:subtilisin family serine protease